MQLTEVDVEASLLFGNALIYAAFDRRPKLGDHDFTSALAASQDILNIVSATTPGVYWMIITTTGTGIYSIFSIVIVT